MVSVSYTHLDVYKRQLFFSYVNPIFKKVNIFFRDTTVDFCIVNQMCIRDSIYPVYSMTDGVVENIGWLRLGGYRIRCV